LRRIILFEGEAATSLNIALGGSSPAVSEATLISGNIGLDAVETKRQRGAMRTVTAAIVEAMRFMAPAVIEMRSACYLAQCSSNHIAM
jgi:hypothetical protein